MLSGYERICCRSACRRGWTNVGLQARGAAILGAMLADKKAQASGLALILVRGIGGAFVAKGVDLARLSEFLERQA